MVNQQFKIKRPKYIIPVTNEPREGKSPFPSRIIFFTTPPCPARLSSIQISFLEGTICCKLIHHVGRQTTASTKNHLLAFSP